MDCQHGVTLDDAHPHRCTHGRVHTSTGSADVHNGHIDVTLPVTDGHNETAEGDSVTTGSQEESGLEGEDRSP